MTSVASYKRRYVGGRESLAYVLCDSSVTFNIDGQRTFFVLNVLRLNPRMNTVIELINGWWDVANDGFLGALIDKTHTRWGKFKPYFFSYVTFGSLLMMLRWLFPYFFLGQLREPGTTLSGFAPLFFWLLIATSHEVFASVRGIAEAGMVSGISPNPNDRVRLYTLAEPLSSAFENIPSVVMSLLIDAIRRRDVTQEVRDAMFRSAFASMGVVTVAVSALLAGVFLLQARERISQTAAESRPNYLKGLRIILRSRPLRTAIFAELFTGIARSVTISEQWEKFYFMDVLGSALLRDVVMIPGAPLSFISYTYLNRFRERFSVKGLWLFSLHSKEMVSLVILLAGSFGNLFRSKAVMLPLLLLQDLLYKGTHSFSKVIPKEISMDTIDYVEWKDGFRAEGLILSTKSMIPKAVKNTLSALTTLIMSAIGYRQGAATQPLGVQRSLFRMAFGLPVAISAMGMVPKLFYDLTGEKRERMYRELTETRNSRQAQYNAIGGEAP